MPFFPLAAFILGLQQLVPCFGFLCIYLLEVH